jgi:diguanylate cyclase
MSRPASERNTPAPDGTLAARAARVIDAVRALARRTHTPAPALLAGAALLCLLIGLLTLTLQMRTIFSGQLQQEYVGLVLEAVERADAARGAALALEDSPPSDPLHRAAYQGARVEFAARLSSLNALIAASPDPAPPFPATALSPASDLHQASSALDSAYTYWRGERDRTSTDLRARVISVSHTLIALSVIVFGVLISALGLYAKRNRQLAGLSQEFEQASLHDAMTGLPNRRKLFAALEAAADAVKDRRVAVLYIDLDGFKRVNDTRGHRIGDEFLIAVSRRFRQTVRGDDVVARIGGDEFAVLVPAFSSDTELAAIAQRIIACVAETDGQMGLSLVRASIGIATFPDRVADYWRLVAAADDTMYTVKRNGKNGFAFASLGG